MNKRQKNKQETRQNILQAAKKEFIKNGLLNISTVEIARQASIAHGTIFFHFQNKENLLIEMIDRELLTLTGQLLIQLQATQDIHKLLQTYLDFLEKEEDFFAVIARETPLYHPELRRSVLGRQAAVRAYFHSTLENGIQQGHYKTIDITTALHFLFSAIDQYLCLRTSYTDQDSVIRTKRADLTQTFIQMISKSD